MTTDASSQNVVQIPISHIVIDKALGAIPMMAESELLRLQIAVLEKGIQDPLWLRKDGDKLILVNGRNRLEAAKREKLETVPCIVKPSANPLEDALDSAFARRNLTKTGVAYTLFKVFPEIADRDENHDSGRFGDKGPSTVHRMDTSGDKGPSGVHKMDTRRDKGPTIRSLSNKYGIHPDYLCSIIDVMKACRPGSNDDEKVAHMIQEESIGHTNLLKGLLGWQVSHPMGGKSDPSSGKTPKKAPVNVIDGMKRSFTFIRCQSNAWEKLKPAEKTELMEQFARTWALLPPSMQEYAVKHGKTKDYDAARKREAELAKPIGPRNPKAARVEI